jgi:hypothetical protein
VIHAPEQSTGRSLSREIWFPELRARRVRALACGLAPALMADSETADSVNHFVRSRRQAACLTTALSVVPAREEVLELDLIDVDKAELLDKRALEVPPRGFERGRRRFGRR